MKTTSSKDKIIAIVMGLAMLLQTLFIVYVQGRYAFMLEDLTFSINMGTGLPLSNLWDVLTNIPDIIKDTGGSVLALSVLQVIILLGETAADIINTLMLLLVAFLISKVVSPKKFDMLFMSMSFFMLTSLNSDWQYTYLWEFGIVNYVFPAVPFLIFLGFILKEVNYSDNKTSGLGAFFATLCSFVAAWANASYGVILIILCAASIIISKKLLAKPVAKWVFASLISSVVGFLLYVVIPGNFKPASVMSGVYLAFSIFPAVVLALLMLAVSLRSGSFLSIGQILLVFVLMISVLLRYIVAIIPGIALNGFAVCTLILAITLFCSLFNNLRKDNRKHDYWGYLLAAVALIYSVLVMLEDIGGVS